MTATGWFNLKYLAREMLLLWWVMSPGLRFGKDSKRPRSSLSHQSEEGIKLASGARASDRNIWKYLSGHRVVYLNVLQNEKVVSKYVNVFSTWEGECSMCSLWDVLKESVKLKLFNMFSFIYLYGFRRVVGMEDDRMEGRTCFTSEGLT